MEKDVKLMKTSATTNTYSIDVMFRSAYESLPGRTCKWQQWQQLQLVFRNYICTYLGTLVAGDTGGVDGQ